MALLETQVAKYFLHVAHAKSLSRAAIELATTQSNVTTRIKQLEEQLGSALLRRHSRGVELTDAGVALLPYCEELVRIAEAAQRSVSGAGVMHAQLRIGVFHTAANHLMPQLLASFMSGNRGVHLTVRVGSTEEMRVLLVNGHIDCAVIAGVGVDASMSVHARFQDELGWLLKKGALRGGSREILIELSSMPIYSTKKGGLYEASIRQLFQDAGVTAAMPLFQELGSIEILKAMLLLGNGFTFISRGVFRSEIEDGIFEFFPVENQLPRLHPALVSKAGRPRSEVLEAFIRHFNQHVSK